MERQLLKILECITNRLTRDWLLIRSECQQQAVIRKLIQAARHSITGPSDDVDGFRDEYGVERSTGPRHPVGEVVMRFGQCQGFEVDLITDALIESVKTATGEPFFKFRLRTEDHADQRRTIVSNISQGADFFEKFVSEQVSLIDDQDNCLFRGADAEQPGTQIEPQFCFVLAAVLVAHLEQNGLQQRSSRREVCVAEVHNLESLWRFAHQVLAQQSFSHAGRSGEDSDSLPSFETHDEFVKCRLHGLAREKAARIGCRGERTTLHAKEGFVHSRPHGLPDGDHEPCAQVCAHDLLKHVSNRYNRDLERKPYNET